MEAVEAAVQTEDLLMKEGLDESLRPKGYQRPRWRPDRSYFALDKVCERLSCEEQSIMIV